MGQEKYTRERERTVAVELTDLSRKEDGEDAEGELQVAESLSDAQRAGDLAANSVRLKHSFEELSESLTELSEAIEETIQ